jgi:peptide/nickel transport system permease protein
VRLSQGTLASGRIAFGATILIALWIASFVGPWLHPIDPMEMVGRPFVWPGVNPTYPLGTDQLGRDVLSGLLSGAQISLEIGVVSAASAILIGLAVGAAAGGIGGYADDLLMRVCEVFQTIPGFILAIVLLSIFGVSVTKMVVCISIVSWPPVARIVRAEMLSLRQRDFVASCRLIGMTRARIILTQMLPNSLAPVFVMASMITASAILIEAALSFLNLSDPNLMSWGKMIGNGRAALRTSWYLVALPGGAIFVTTIALNILGEGVSDVLNRRRTSN